MRNFRIQRSLLKILSLLDFSSLIFLLSNQIDDDVFIYNDPKILIKCVTINLKQTIQTFRFGIRAYPTFLVINDKHGTRQEYLGNKDNGQELVEWASTVAKEWTWLFRRSAVTSFADPAHFSRTLLSPAVAASSSSSSRRRSTSATSSSSSRGDDDDSSSSSSMLWLVLFTDGVDCQPCKTAKTNLMRVSAGLYGLPASVGLVDCTQPAMAGFCYGQPDGACNLAASSAAAPGKGEMQGGEDWVAAATAALPCHALPEVPHAPVLKAFVVNKLQEKAGKEKEKEGSLNRVDEIAAQLARRLQGEMLYNNNEVPLLAFD